MAYHMFTPLPLAKWKSYERMKPEEIAGRICLEMVDMLGHGEATVEDGSRNFFTILEEKIAAAIRRDRGD